MRVIVNELQSLKQRTGIGHYTAELLRCARLQAPDDQIDGFPTGWVRRTTAACFRAGSQLAQPASLRAMFAGPVSLLRDGWQAFLNHRFYRLCARGKYDLYHEPNFLPMATDCTTVATLHDLSVVLHPEWHPADRVRRFEQRLPGVLADCAHFLADTESVRHEVMQKLGVPAERISRVYMGIRPDLCLLPNQVVERELARLGLPPQYLLSVGTIEPRKNLLRLMQVYCSLPESLRSDWPLVIAGGWGWNAGQTQRYLEDVGRHCGVLHLGYVADDQLPLLYNGARALLFPSYYEGFGLPPLEMMACGGAVIASTAAALVETVSGQAHLLHPEDDHGWREAIIRVVRDNDWWRSLRKGARQRAWPFTWERCAEETLAVYRSACGTRLPLAA
jgi:alpha-1,3-rhamnosyl/mannosyltransferase